VRRRTGADGALVDRKMMTLASHSRRLAAAAALAGLALIASALTWAVGDAAAARNVVVVMTDDQDARSLRVMQGVKRQLGGSGTTFENFFATFPVCCPSRATFLTGQYAHNHGVRGNLPPAGGVQAFDDSRTLAVALRRAGYRTGYVGRYLNGYDSRRVPPGWSDWHVGMGKSAFRMYDYTLNENGRLERYGSSPSDYQTDVYARKATRFVRGGSRPFFLTFAPLAPHADPSRTRPPNPEPAPRHRGAFAGAALPRPPSFNELDVSDKPRFVRNKPLLSAGDQRRLKRQHQDRLASLLAVDDAVKRIVKTLRETGELRDTLILFTSDNGYMLGEHRLVAKGVLYEESVDVPLIMRGPGVPSGVRRSQIAGNIDLAPTIFDFTGVRPLDSVDGSSLLPLARDGSVAADRDILFENQNSAAVRTQRYMYAEHSGGEAELYDLREDPFQLRSRHADPALASVRATLAQRLAQLRNCTGASCR
jgi:arylsulfatase A-like enzyme